MTSAPSEHPAGAVPAATDRPSVRNVDQLRHAIDSGETGDKIPARDPAAAPLGTDEEAAGTPPSPELIQEVAAVEISRPNSRGGISGSRGLWIWLAGPAIIAIAVLSAVLFR